MNETMQRINKLLVDSFNDVLIIEEKALKNGPFNDVSITEVHTVEAIGMYEKKTMSEVAKILDITVGTLTVAVNKLVKKDYVRRLKSDGDKRIVFLLYRVHAKFHNDMVMATIGGMDDKEIEILAKALEHLNDFLREEYFIIKGEK